MTDLVAKKAAKYLLKEKVGGRPKNGDDYRYVASETKRGKQILKKKDEEYFRNVLGIPKKDAHVLAKVMHRARYLDGAKVLWFRFGVSAAIQLIPEVGDIIDGFLSVAIIKTANGVSGGLDKGYKRDMTMNVVKQVVIGLVPYLGDLADSLLKANTKNFLLLEEMLTARVYAEKEKLRDAEKAGHAPTREQTSRHGHRHDDSRTAEPAHYDGTHGNMHKRLNNSAHEDSAHSSGNSRAGGWLNRLQSRGKYTTSGEDAAPARPPRPATNAVVQDLTRGEGTAPAQPPRHGTARHQPVGSF